MKWIAEIFVVVLCLVAGGLYVSGQKKDAHIQRLNAAMEVHNEQLRLHNREFLYTICEGIREEVLNQRKRKNEGLLDTLKYLNEQVDQLLDKAELSDIEAWRQISWMKEVHDHQLWDKHAGMASISLDSLQSITPPERVMELLFKEQELLEVLNMRFGISGFAPEKIVVEHIPVATSVLAGEPLHVWFQLPIWFGWNRGVRFEAKRGTITYIPGETHAILTMPTDQVLLPGQQAAWLNYSATVIIPKVTGGYERIPVEGKVRVVRKWPGG